MRVESKGKDGGGEAAGIEGVRDDGQLGRKEREVGKGRKERKEMKEETGEDTLILKGGFGSERRSEFARHPPRLFLRPQRILCTRMHGQTPIVSAC